MTTEHRAQVIGPVFLSCVAAVAFFLAGINALRAANDLMSATATELRPAVHASGALAPLQSLHTLTVAQEQEVQTPPSLRLAWDTQAAAYRLHSEQGAP